MLALRPMRVQNDPTRFLPIHLAMAPSMAPSMAPTSTPAAAPTVPHASSRRVAARALTDAAIRALRDGESRTDGSLPVGAGRLIIECRKSKGTLRRRWLFRYRTASTSGKLLMGDYPSVGLEAARVKAREHIEQVRRGVDPLQASTELRQSTIRAEREKAALGTFRALLSAYVASLKAKGRSSARDVELIFERHVLKP
jgi:Arm DNA-binding domain